MHDIKWIRDNAEAFDKAMHQRRKEEEFSSDAILKLDDNRRAAITAFEQAQARLKATSKEIDQARRSKDETQVSELMEKVSLLKTELGKLKSNQEEKKAELDNRLAEIPNIPAADVPEGADEHGNVQHHVYGAPRSYGFTPKPHYDLGEALGQMDFEAAARLSGARFVVLKNGLARMERALAQFMLDLHTTEHGYMEVAPPILVRDEAMFGTAQLPKFKDDQFFASRIISDQERKEQYNRFSDQKLRPHIDELLRQLPANFGRRETMEAIVTVMNEHLPAIGEEFDSSYEGKQFFWLIPTAEVPLTNLVRELILSEDQLPIRMTACTPCFRAEAGAAGKDTRGMIRQHQFNKVELVSITTPETSRDEHERMLSCAEEVLRRLDLHYRVVTLCTGDMGFASQKTYDIEVWMPGQNEGKGAFREISSCSVCGDFQARRMNARYRDKANKVRHVHTLNGSGVAVGRALIAVIENYQQADGSIAVPDVLQPYMGGTKVIGKDA
jgi:seryl-tRNA synthetase